VGGGQQHADAVGIPSRIRPSPLDHPGALMRHSLLFAACPMALLLLCAPATSPIATAAAATAETQRPPAPTLRPARSAALPVDPAGFIRRWLVLEPASVNGRLTQDEVEKALKATERTGMRITPRA